MASAEILRPLLNLHRLVRKNRIKAESTVLDCLLENPNGMRVQDLFIGNERVDKTKKYFASFVTIQGIPRKYGTNRRDLEIKAIDALKQYIVKKGTISIELHGTVQII